MKKQNIDYSSRIQIPASIPDTQISVSIFFKLLKLHIDLLQILSLDALQTIELKNIQSVREDKILPGI